MPRNVPEAVEKLVAPLKDKWRRLSRKPVDDLTEEEVTDLMFGLRSLWDDAYDDGDEQEMQRLADYYGKMCRRRRPNVHIPINSSKLPYWV